MTLTWKADFEGADSWRLDNHTLQWGSKSYLEEGSEQHRPIWVRGGEWKNLTDILEKSLQVLVISQIYRREVKDTVITSIALPSIDTVWLEYNLTHSCLLLKVASLFSV